MHSTAQYRIKVSDTIEGNKKKHSNTNMVLDLNGLNEDTKFTLTYLLKINTMQASAHSV
jgi:hypothetical protein